MPTKVFLVDFDDTDAQKKPGALWRIPLDHRYTDETVYDVSTTWGALYHDMLSPEFRVSGRDFTYCLRLPDGTAWNLDMKSSTSLSGWTVTGEAPKLTAHPSVNVIGSYHGWLVDGELSDDLDRRG